MGWIKGLWGVCGVINTENEKGRLIGVSETIVRAEIKVERK